MPNKLIHQFNAPSATEGRASRVERAAKLKADIQSMEDAALQSGLPRFSTTGRETMHAMP